jgi:hypothetical protein
VNCVQEKNATWQDVNKKLKNAEQSIQAFFTFYLENFDQHPWSQWKTTFDVILLGLQTRPFGLEQQSKSKSRKF